MKYQSRFNKLYQESIRVDNIKQRLIKKAMNRFPGEMLRPCGNNETLNQCFTSLNNKIIFWYNIENDKFKGTFTETE